VWRGCNVRGPRRFRNDFGGHRHGGTAEADRLSGRRPAKGGGRVVWPILKGIFPGAWGFSQ